MSTKNTSKATSYDEAKAAAEARASARATGAAIVKVDDQAEQAMTIGDASGGMIATFDEAAARELMSGDYEVAPRFVKLEIGTMVRGKLVDRGSVEITETDPRTGEVYSKEVATWTIENSEGTARLRFLSSHQLDEDLTRDGGTGPDGAALPRVPRFGEHVSIARLQDERTGKGRVVTRYAVAFKRAGVRR